MVNDGGPAFPGECGNKPDDVRRGMSLRAFAAIKLGVPQSGIDWLDAMIVSSNRDRFAGQIINGILSSYEYKRDAKDGAMLIRDSICEAAYELADAMLKAREVPDAK